MWICDKELKQIGYKDLMKKLDIKSPYGYRHKQQVNVYTSADEQELELEYDRLEQVMSFVLTQDITKIELLLSHLKNLQLSFEKCHKGHVLDLVDLYEIKMQALVMNELMAIWNNEGLSIEIVDCEPIITILSPNDERTYDFYLYETYSETLKTIRDEKRRIEGLYFKESNQDEKLRLKQLRAECVLKEQLEEQVVRQTLSRQLQEQIDIMIKNSQRIGHIDYLIAKAKLAITYQCTRPQIDKDEFSLTHMFHPLMKDQLEALGLSYQANSIVLNKGTTLLTGANMSGKSSILKTVTLNVTLAQHGFFVFAKEAKIPLVEKLVYVATDEEQNRHGLSSFGLEITKINETIGWMKEKRCLVVIDEFARSTNPTEGQRFVRAFATLANQYPSYTLLSTHYDGVAKGLNHYQIAGLKEFQLGKSVTISDINQMMDYTLKRVSTKQEVPKEAYYVSLLLGIDDELKEVLKECYGSDLDE